MIVIAATVMISACTTVNWAENNPYVASAAVQAGTVKFIEESSVPIGRADNVIAVVQLAKEHMEERSDTTIGDIVGVVRGLIDWDELTQYESILLESLISSVESRLRNDIGSGLISAEDKVKINAFLDWTIEAARGYKMRNG